MEKQLSSFQEIFNFYHNFIQSPNFASLFQAGQLNVVFPIVPVPVLVGLNDAVSRIFAKEPCLLNLNCEINVIGDLHGHIFDLFRILKIVGFPPEKNYLFLGDFVDRGEFSIETITLIYVLKVLFPNNVYILRGNHEFADMFSKFGFSNELESFYNAPFLNKSFNNSFSLMPLAALVNDSILCVHGGIGPEITTISQISDLKRPIFGYEDQIVSSLVWSDPSPTVSTFSPSARGLGHLFGLTPLQTFLSSQTLDIIVRGHECVKDGIEYALDYKIVTVFSASNYCGMLGNKSGVLILKPDKTHEDVTFPFLPYIKRAQVNFIKSESEYEFKMPNGLFDQKAQNHLPSLHSNPVGSYGHRPILSSNSSSDISVYSQQNNSTTAQITSRVSAMVKMKPLNILGGKSMSSRTPASSLRNDDLFRRATNVKMRANSVFTQLPPRPKIATFADDQITTQSQD